MMANGTEGTVAEAASAQLGAVVDAVGGVALPPPVVKRSLRLPFLRGRNMEGPPGSVGRIAPP